MRLPRAQMISTLLRVDVAVITVTNTETRATAEATATTLRTAGTPAIVGGQGNDLTELIDLTRLAAVRQR